MKDQLRDLQHDEAEGIEVPSAPINAITSGARRRHRVARLRALAAAASVLVTVGLVVGVSRHSDGQTPTTSASPPAALRTWSRSRRSRTQPTRPHSRSLGRVWGVTPLVPT